MVSEDGDIADLGRARSKGPISGRVLTADIGDQASASVVVEDGVCCDELVTLLEDEDVPLDYDGRVREWSLYVFSLADPEQPDWREHLTRQNLWFCPLCGFRFPDSVRIPYFERLRANGIDDPWLQRDEVPLEYKSETWWREAGL